MTPGRDQGTVETTVRDGVVWVRLDGVVMFQTMLAAVKAAAEATRANATDRVVFDLRSGTYPAYEAAVLESARHAANVGLSAALRIAVVGQEGDPKLAFVREVAAYRGAQVGTFSDEAPAIAWVNARRR